MSCGRRGRAESEPPRVIAMVATMAPSGTIARPARLFKLRIQEDDAASVIAYGPKAVPR
jgi:hypothetical protein